MLNTNKETKKECDFTLDKPSNFRKDLEYGQEREKRVMDLLHQKAGTKFEVKTERDWWHRTDNIAIEIACNGEPSGVMATKSEQWIHILADPVSGKDCCKMWFDTSTVKRLAEKYKKNTKNGGDGYRSKFVLIPLSEILLAKNLIENNGKEK